MLHSGFRLQLELDRVEACFPMFARRSMRRRYCGRIERVSSSLPIAAIFSSWYDLSFSITFSTLIRINVT